MHSIYINGYIFLIADVKIDILEPQKKTGNPEVDAMQNKNGHVNTAFVPSNPEPTPTPQTSTQL